MAKTFDCDVAVVGAGPAGSRTARDIARRGFKVMLLEEHRRIGVPSHCSGLVSPRTLEVAAISQDIILNRLTGAYVHTTTGKELAIGGDAVRAVAIDRIHLDELLAEQAQSAGAELVRARLLRAEREENGLRLVCQRPDWVGELTFRAKLVIGADGAYSRVARTLGLPKPQEHVYALGLEGHLRVPRQDFVHVFVSHKLAPGWFGWIIPIGDDQVRVGIGCYGSDKPIRCYGRLREAFPHLFANVESYRMFGGTIPTAMAPRTYSERVMLVGDAAGQVKPFSGGGIYTGLVAAGLCAATAIEALEQENLSAAVLQRYEARWKEELGKELARSLGIRRFGLALSEREVDWILFALRRPGLQGIISRYGDIDYPSRLFLRLPRDLPALAMLALISLRRPLVTFRLLRALAMRP